MYFIYLITNSLYNESDPVFFQIRYGEFLLYRRLHRQIYIAARIPKLKID